ncbi:MAG: hypothetical protein M3R06_06835 [Chloroflexota bacterium]|nr:hypothetical protein [Chloroflexota bacterium]
MIAIVLGPDSSIADGHVTRLLDERDPDRASTTVIDGRTTSLSKIRSAAGTVGFFGGRTIVVLDLLAQLVGTGSSAPNRDAAKSSTKSQSRLPSLFESVAPDNTLLLLDKSLVSISASVKRTLPSDVRIFSSAPPRGRELVEWTIAAAAAAGARLESSVATYVLQTLFPQSWSSQSTNARYDQPPDLALLQRELDKLVLAAHPDPVTKRHVELHCASGSDGRMFGFVDAAYGGQLAVALKELAKLIEEGEDLARVSVQLDQQTELAGVLDAAAGLDPNEVATAIGLANPQRLRGISRNLQHTSSDNAANRIHAAREADWLVKRGQLRSPADGLYHRLVK